MMKIDAIIINKTQCIIRYYSDFYSDLTSPITIIPCP